MKRGLIYGLLILIAYGFFLLLRVPADSLAAMLTERLPGFSVQRVTGSAFSGSAYHLRWGERNLDQVDWRWQPLGLLSGKLEYRLTLSAPDMQVAADAGIGWDRRLRLYDVSGSLPLPKAISLAGRPPPPVNGTLDLAITELLLDRHGKPREAWGKIWLHDAHTAFGRTLQLGDIELELSTENEIINGEFQDTGGPLELIGSITLDANDSYRFDSRIGVRGDEAQDLRQALGLLGRPDQEGRWRLRHAGQLTL